MTITMDKKYRTRSGNPVRIICIDRKGGNYPVVGLMTTKENAEEVHGWTKAGTFYTEPKTKSPFDLVEVLPYYDFKKDDPVLVRDYPNDPWRPRHFAGVDQRGKPLTWVAGKTSFSVEDTDEVISWKFCVKAKPDDAPCDEASK